MDTAGTITKEDAETKREERSKDSAPWLALIKDGEDAFRTYQDKSDKIDKRFASLERLANAQRDRDFQIFWANLEVLKPSIYARAPVPVVVPRFKDRKPLPRAACDVLERCSIVSFEIDDIDAVLRSVRDDLARNARGVAWARYEKKDQGAYPECVRWDHVNRKDFTHDPAREWREGEWVARRAWLSRKQQKKRFSGSSGDAYLGIKLRFKKDNETDSEQSSRKGAVWELWHKTENIVVWVAEGVSEVLDMQKPWLELEGFWPMPRPAYGTVQPETLIPVADFLQYQDQLDEIQEITERIHALTDALRLKFLYPGGSGEIGDIVENAMKAQNQNAMGIPVSGFAAMGTQALKDVILWLPVDMVAATIKELIELRKQLIEDVYQISGLSDIMRGATNPNETLGAQKLKSQYGSIRIRDRQDEMIRMARDMTRITAEIMAENFSPATLMLMSQVELPSDADIAQKVAPLQQQLAIITDKAEQIANHPLAQQKAQENPQAAQQLMQQVQQQVQGLQGQIQQLQSTITIDQVVKLLRAQRVRPFVLDIETDSTIQPDEDAAKQRATELLTSIGTLLGQALPEVKQMPEAAPLVAESLKYAASQFRASREMQTAIDEFADKMEQLAKQPKPQGPTPEQVKQQADAAKVQQDAKDAVTQAQLAQANLKLDTEKAKADALLRDADQKLKETVAAKDAEIETHKLALDKYKADLSSKTSITVAEIGANSRSQDTVLKANVDANLAAADHQQEALLQADEHAHERELNNQNQTIALHQQEVDQAHQAEMQDNSNQAALEQQAVKPKPGAE